MVPNVAELRVEIRPARDVRPGGLAQRRRIAIPRLPTLPLRRVELALASPFPRLPFRGGLPPHVDEAVSRGLPVGDVLPLEPG